MTWDTDYSSLILGEQVYLILELKVEEGHNFDTPQGPTPKGLRLNLRETKITAAHVEIEGTEEVRNLTESELLSIQGEIREQLEKQKEDILERYTEDDGAYIV